MTEEQAVQLAASPDKIISALQCSAVISYLNGIITDMALAEFELEILASQHQVDLLHTEGKTNKTAEAEWKVSEPYKEWKRHRLQLQKFRAYRHTLKKKEETLSEQEKYKTYPRAI